jgi:hypothetical protein
VSAREQAKVVAAAVSSTLLQLPTDVLDVLWRHGITVVDLSRAIGNNAAQALVETEGAS